MEYKKIFESYINEGNDGWPETIEYGEKTYKFDKKRGGKYIYINSKKGDSGDELVFATKKEMKKMLDDYSSPIGGRQSSQF